MARKLMLIAVDVDSGTISEPGPNEPYPRVLGLLDSQDLDSFVDNLLKNKKAERVRKANTADEPYKGTTPPTDVAKILHTHNSPGCTWVIVNGWPFCY